MWKSISTATLSSKSIDTSYIGLPSHYKQTNNDELTFDFVRLWVHHFYSSSIPSQECLRMMSHKSILPVAISFPSRFCNPIGNLEAIFLVPIYHRAVIFVFKNSHRHFLPLKKTLIILLQSQSAPQPFTPLSRFNLINIFTKRTSPPRTDRSFSSPSRRRNTKSPASLTATISASKGPFASTYLKKPLRRYSFFSIIAAYFLCLSPPASVI